MIRDWGLVCRDWYAGIGMENRVEENWEEGMTRDKSNDTCKDYFFLIPLKVTKGY